MSQLSLDPVVNLEALIQDVLSGDIGPWKLQPKHSDLLELLRPHKGRALARPISAIAERLGMSEREVKGAVKSLVEDFGLPIGASRQEPYGYFLIVSADDLEFTLRPLANEVISIARRMRKLGGSALVKEMLGQLRVEMEA
jgi:biotin operon repressor